MSTAQAKPISQRKKWLNYLLLSIGTLLSLLLIFGLVYLWKEIQNAGGYSYLGGFIVGILGGVAIIPAPSLAITFSLGSILNPLYIGLLSGLGEATGEITVYLTGAGGGALWSKFRTKQQTLYNKVVPNPNNPETSKSKLYSRWKAFSDRLVALIGKRGGSWAIFLGSMMIPSPSYFIALSAGSIRFGLQRYFLLSWAGKTVKGLIVAFAGYWGLRFLLQWLGG